jgi:hypothetical protein
LHGLPTLHRFAGLDHGTPIHYRHLRKIAFSISGRRENLKSPSKLSGRQAAVNALIPFLGPLDTSHISDANRDQ